MAESAPAMSAVLGGVRVLELGGGVGSSLCTRLLAEHGADVIKVEPPGRGDPVRAHGPFARGRPEPDTGALFLALNGGKRSCVLDLGSASGRTALLQLVAGADVVVSGLEMHETAELGLDDSVLAAANPRCVRVVVSPFGLSGPLADSEFSELTLCCAGGLAYITGAHDDPPTRSALDQAQYVAGAHAGVGALAALCFAEATGAGQLVEVSIQEVLAGILQGKLTYYSYMGCVARRQPRSSGSLQHALMPCADGWIAPMFVPTANVDWELFATFLELPVLLEERFSTRAGRIAHSGELERILGERFAEKGKYEWFHDAQAWRLTFGVVQTAAEMLDCPQLGARGFWSEVTHSSAGPLRLPGRMIRGDDGVGELGPAPRLGEHTAEVLADAGIDAVDLLALTAAPPARRQRSRAAAAPPTATGPDGSERRTSTAGDNPGPLAGIRVVECGEAYAVPHLTRLLADLGAEVIKLESCSRPDVVRVWPFPGNRAGDEFWNRGGVFNEPNRNKRGITLDLRTMEGVALFKRLIAGADVFCENYTPRVMAQLGLAYDDLVAVKPDLVMLSSTGYGHGGPWRDYTAWGFTIEPTAGICDLVGRADGPPLRTGIAYVDMPAAAVGAVAVLAALRGRDRSGRGRWIDLSQYEVGAAFIAEAPVAAGFGRPVRRDGNRHPAHAPQGVYRCAGSDRWVGLTVRSDAEFAALAGVIGDAALVDDPRYATAEDRRVGAESLDARIEMWTRGRTAEEAADSLGGARLPAAVVMTVRDLLLDPHLRARGYWEAATHRPECGDLGTRIYPGMAVRLHGTPGRIRTPAPMLGEHNDEILGALGVDAAERGRLEAAGVIGRRPVQSRIDTIDQHEVPYENLFTAGIIEARDEDYLERLGLR